MTTPNSEYGMEEISIAKARAMLSRLPELLSAENRAVALTRHGKPVMAMMSWANPDLMTALRQSIEDARAGRFISLDQVKTNWSKGRPGPGLVKSGGARIGV